MLTTVEIRSIIHKLTAETAVQTVSTSGTAPLTLSASKTGTAVTVSGSVAEMKAATASAAGSAGIVPAPAAGKQASFLRGDGTWAVPTNTNTTYTFANGDTYVGEFFNNKFNGKGTYTKDGNKYTGTWKNNKYTK